MSKYRIYILDHVVYEGQSNLGRGCRDYLMSNCQRILKKIRLFLLSLKKKINSTLMNSFLSHYKDLMSHSWTVSIATEKINVILTTTEHLFKFHHLLNKVSLSTQSNNTR